MSIRPIFLTSTALTIVITVYPSLLGAAEQTAAPVVKNLSEEKLEHSPGLPSCAIIAVLSGDPLKGASVIEAKATSGCRIPWHWHSSNEHVMMVSGVGKMEMKDAKPATLRSGAYAMMPAHHAHQFTCTASCTMFLYSDGVFDTHYVDASGNEISATDALKTK